MRRISLLILSLFIVGCAFAQRGKDGNVTISSAKTVNEYTTLTADASAGSTSITVANSGLNTKGRFAGNLAAGDLIMIIQMQGATIEGQPYFWGAAYSDPLDTLWGEVTNYNNAGNYEFAEVSAVPNATTITLDCGLEHDYTAAGRVQVIRVPRYNNLTVNAGVTVSCDAWDSSKGGIVAIEVLGNTVINGTVDASHNGFRGATLDDDSSGYGVNNPAANIHLRIYGKAKGEGIAGYYWMYDQYGGRYCKGAPANGGGGANAHNCGGGGGSNGGNVAGWKDGFGNPDVSTANNIAAWKLEYSWMPTLVNSGGGRGGYSFSSVSKNPTTVGPGNTAWSGDYRRANGGLGGRPLDYSTGRIFIGGGGGAGDQDNNVAGAGGNGGGMVYIVSYGTVSGSGVVLANGANGANSTYNASSNSGDGAGGAGGGGTVIINSTGNISGISIQANGGTGGNQQINSAFTSEAEGPGGGGGGGYIATSNTGLTESATGGANGTTNAAAMTKFPPNGATAGGVGTTGATITNFQIVAQNDTVCTGSTATLTASLTGTVPGGITINWYTTQVGGSPLASGNSYTTPVITADTTFYVGTCPGTYRQAVHVIVGSSAKVSINAPSTICSGNTIALSASGGTSYSWSPASSLSNPNVSNPVASPTVTTTYTVNITTGCGPAVDSVKITVAPAINTTVSAANTTICNGDSTKLTASGGTSYTWNNGDTTSVITVSPSSNTTYTVQVSKGGCTKDTSIQVAVNQLPSVSFSGTTTICSGTSTTITASGGGTYSWSTGGTASAITVSPSTNTTYTVQVTNAGCKKDSSIAITVNTTPTVTVNPPSPGVCSGGSVGLTASGAATYSWSASSGLSCTTCSNPNASPASTTTYTVIGTSAAGGCIDSAMVTVTVGSSLTASIAGKDTICKGDSTTLTASGGSSYVWSNGATTASINVSPSSNFTYNVTVSNGSCPSDSAKVTVHVNPLPAVSISGNNSICAGGSTTLTATGGTTYTWSTGATTGSITVTPSADSIYIVNVSNGSCKNKDSVKVTVNANPVPAVSPTQDMCAGTSVSLSASGGTSYTWSPSTGLSSSVIANPLANPGLTTTYTVTVANGSCTAKDSVMVIVNPAPAGGPCCNTTIVKGQSTNLTVIPVVAGNTYNWSPVSGLSCNTCPAPTATPTVTTTYYLIVTDTNGCTKRDSVIITVNENCGEVFVPTAFSPNKDGQNDVLYVEAPCVKTMDFMIYDRWGNKVFESTDPTVGWDGTYKGQPMNTGTYVYYFNAITIYNDNIVRKGNITLIR